MAARSGAGVGVVITISILGVVAFGFFIGTLILWGNLSKTHQALEQEQAVNRDFVTAPEREIERVKELVGEARSENATLVRYLVDSQADLMDELTGFREDSVEEFLGKTQQLVIGVPNVSERTLAEAIQTNGHIFGVLEDLSRQATAFDERAIAAEDARDDLEDELRERIEEFDAFRDSQVIATRDLQRQIDDLQRDAEDYREGILRQEQVYAERLDTFEREATAREENLRARLEELDRANLLLQDQVSRYRQDERDAGETLQPLPEAALVDARVIEVAPADREAWVSLGSSDNVVLGMRFSVYGDPTLIRPDANGDYPPGKASVEIISIEDETARVRILTEARGNPVVEGDVIANAAYDPSKVYKFMVLGNFISSGNREATPGGAEELRALVSGWGGDVIDELSGDVDFLVLGERPRIPPQPPVDAPINVFDEFRRQERKAERYDLMLEYARATSIPVLNQNRLFTLIGGEPSRTR